MIIADSINGFWELPYERSIRQIWNWGYYAHVNVDAGPQVLGFSASPNRIAVGDAVTISYTIAGASQITGNFVENKLLPLYSSSFIVYPDQTTNFNITATSPTGLTVEASVHVDVTPQVLYAPCQGLVLPIVTSLAIDGVSSNLSFNESDTVHVLEVFGQHFLADRPSTTEVNGKVQVLLAHSSDNPNTNLDLIELSSVSNQYIRCKIRAHPYTLAGNYRVFVMNDVGISSDHGMQQRFDVEVTVPKFLMNKPLSGHSGDLATLYIDDYDPVRDLGMALLVNNNAITPITIGGNISDELFIEECYNRILGRPSDLKGFIQWLNKLVVGLLDRYDVMQAFLTSPEYVNSGRDVSVGLGTIITVPIVSSTATGIGLRTNNGISSTQIEFIPIASPPVITSTSNCCRISGLGAISGVPGQIVDIYGSNFTGSTVAFFGNTQLTSTPDTSTHMSFIVPTVGSSVVGSIIIRDGTTCSDNYEGFFINMADISTPSSAIPDGFVQDAEIPVNSGAGKAFWNLNDQKDLDISGGIIQGQVGSSTGSTAAVIDQAVYITTTPVTALVTTTVLNEVPVTNTSNATIDSVVYRDFSPSRVENA